MLFRSVWSKCREHSTDTSMEKKDFFSRCSYLEVQKQDFSWESSEWRKTRRFYSVVWLTGLNSFEGLILVLTCSILTKNYRIHCRCLENANFAPFWYSILCLHMQLESSKIYFLVYQYQNQWFNIQFDSVYYHLKQQLVKFRFLHTQYENDVVWHSSC